MSTVHQDTVSSNHKSLLHSSSSPEMSSYEINCKNNTKLLEIYKTDSHEELSRWLTERKRLYPTKENIVKRYKIQERLLKQGLSIRRKKSRFKKSRTPQQSLLLSQKKKLHTKKKNIYVKKKILIDEKNEWNGNMYPFSGTSELKLQHISILESEDEWTSLGNDEIQYLPNALGSLMAAYESADEDNEITERKPSSAASEKLFDCIYAPENNKKQKILPMGNKQRICKQSLNMNTKSFKQNVALLKMLLESEIRHERNVLLQCVRYVVQKYIN